MRRIINLLLLICFSLILSACTGESNVDFSTKTIEIESILNIGGYRLDEQGQSTAFYFVRDDINEKYDLDLTIYQLYIAEKEGSEDVYYIVFWEIEDAATYEEAYNNNPDLEERYFHREENIVILTYSKDAIELFD